MDYVRETTKPMVAPSGFVPKKACGTPEQKAIRRMTEEAQVSCSGHRRTFIFKIHKDESNEKGGELYDS